MSELNDIEFIFDIGAFVHAKDNAMVKLQIRRYVNSIYYCKIVDDPMHKELVYFGRELAINT